MPNEVVSVDSRVSCKGEGPVETVQDKVSEFVSSANSEALRVDPHHGQFMEQHFEVNHRVHSNLSRDEKARSCNQDRQVGRKEKALVQFLWVFTRKQNWSKEKEQKV